MAFNNYALHINTRVTPQTEKAKPTQVKNSAGGYVFATGDWSRLNRFLIIGNSGGSYYASEKKLTKENAECVSRCLSEDGLRTVREIVRVSDEGKAPKNDPAIFALALACCADDVEVRRAAFNAIPAVCRIGTHLFQFVENIHQLRSFGQGLRNGIAAWYNDKDVDKLAFQICKYAQRNGWSHRDVLRLVHPVAKSPEHDALFRYIVCGEDGGDERFVTGKRGSVGKDREYGSVAEVPEFIHRFNELKHADEKRTIELIEKYGFTHEMIDTQHKNSADVWEALLQKMPVHAMIRNLNKMTAVGLLKPLSQNNRLVINKLENGDQLKRSRLHPLTVLGAQRVYRKGHGDKGSLSWAPVPQIVDALESAFYKSFDYVEPSNKNFLLGIDVSGSMSGEIPGTGLSSCDVAACTAMVTARTEPNYYFKGFAGNFVDLGITAKMTLPEVQRRCQLSNFGTTDCSLPMQYATQNELDVDVFCVYSDCETYAGSIHPFQALKQYRNKMNKPDAKLVVMATEATNFTIADPTDPNMLDICGWSTDVPQVISAFAGGKL